MSLDVTVLDVGFTPFASTELSTEHARRMAATLDSSVELEDASPLPLLWHWAFFAPMVPTAALGVDGHPSVSSPSPIEDLPRRMWAGGRVRYRVPLVLGKAATRRTRVASATRKSGRTGDLLIVTVEHEIEQDGRLAVVESQDLVYRSAPSGAVALPLPASGPLPAAPEDGWSDVVVVGSVRLFRFSALTFNSHRIHYDHRYATGAEGYPDLVVHGPLTALLLAESARRRVGSGEVFEFRATAPLFADAPFCLVGRRDRGSVALDAVRGDGAVAMTATYSSTE
jgi:3-methylfumaryl-CoA hydratase